MRFFNDAEEDYLSWLRAHPDAYVLNTRAPNGDPAYMVLHKATCKTISIYAQNHRGPAFTGNGYIKVCGKVEELQDWARSRGARSGSFSKRCGICRP